MDFTYKKYEQLLEALKSAGYGFVTFETFMKGEAGERFVILRHDVDLLPRHSYRTAMMERWLSVKASYYFRAVPESWSEEHIKGIASIGHEVGYHYESLTTCQGNVDEAYQDFCRNLERLRGLVPVSTICMHGSPRSPYDSKDIWKKYDYRKLGIIGEPYLDTDFSKMLYLTDTGRRWDGYRVSVRDKVEAYQDEWTEKGWTFHSTDDIIKAIKEKRLPCKLMITTHPQRWNDPGLRWVKELVVQNLKNVVKAMLITHRKQ